MNKKIISMLALGLFLGGAASGIYQVSAQSNTASQITAQQAKQIAETEVGDTASGVTQEEENGRLVYEVQVGDKEVEIDAETGAILEIEGADSGFELFDLDDRSK